MSPIINNQISEEQPSNSTGCADSDDFNLPLEFRLYCGEYEHKPFTPVPIEGESAPPAPESDPAIRDDCSLGPSEHPRSPITESIPTEPKAEMSPPPPSPPTPQPPPQKPKPPKSLDTTFWKEKRYCLNEVEKEIDNGRFLMDEWEIEISKIRDNLPEEIDTNDKREAEVKKLERNINNRYKESYGVEETYELPSNWKNTRDSIVSDAKRILDEILNDEEKWKKFIELVIEFVEKEEDYGQIQYLLEHHTCEHFTEDVFDGLGSNYNDEKKVQEYEFFKNLRKHEIVTELKEGMDKGFHFFYYEIIMPWVLSYFGEKDDLQSWYNKLPRPLQFLYPKPKGKDLDALRPKTRWESK